MMCRSLRLLPAKTTHLSTSWCAATSCPAPADEGLTSLRRPTLQPCPSSWCCKQQGQPCRVRKEPQAQHLGSISHCPGAGGPCTLQVWPRPFSVPRTGCPTKPSRKELRSNYCPCSGVSSRQANVLLHTGRTGFSTANTS